MKVNIVLNNKIDYMKLREVDTKLASGINERELFHLSERQKSEMTNEMMGKLKDVGNQFLGMFGMSTDNFKLNQAPGGGYNISYQG